MERLTTFAQSDCITYAEFSWRKATQDDRTEYHEGIEAVSHIDFTLASLELLYRQTINKIVVAILDCINRRNGKTESGSGHSAIHGLRGTRHFDNRSDCDPIIRIQYDLIEGVSKKEDPKKDTSYNLDSPNFHSLINSFACQHIKLSIRRIKLWKETVKIKKDIQKTQNLLNKTSSTRKEGRLSKKIQALTIKLGKVSTERESLTRREIKYKEYTELVRLKLAYNSLVR